MKIKLSKTIHYYGQGISQQYEAGETIEIEDTDAKDLIHNGYATEVIKYSNKMMKPKRRKRG